MAIQQRLDLGINIGAVEINIGEDLLLIDPVLFQGTLAGLRLWI